MLLKRSANPVDVPERKRFTGPLDIRTPEEEAVSRDDGDEHAPIWSPAIRSAMVDWYDAKQQGDDGALRDAARKIVDATVGYYRMGGVPVFAHHPLPPQLVEAEVGNAHAESGGPAAAIGRFINAFGNSVKPFVNLQVKDHLQRNTMADALAPNGRAYETINPERADARTPNDRVYEVINPGQRGPSLLRDPGSHEPGTTWNLPVHSIPFYRTDERDGREMNTLQYDNQRDKPAAREMQGVPFGQPTKKSEPRIVKPYRRYASDDMAREDRKADALARDADVSIRELIRAIEAEGSFTGDRDLLVQQLLRSLKRYFAEDGGRAVAGVGTSDPEASIDEPGHYAAYDPYSDRIVFSKAFQKAPPAEKIITLIHELLHTTLMIKNVQARSGYTRDRRGGMIFAQHEAILDNIAIRYAKRLKLIPQNYPETTWRRYYKTEEEMRRGR